jgi:hypothetical protein
LVLKWSLLKYTSEDPGDPRVKKRIKITYAINCPEEEKTDSIFGVLFGGQIRNKLNSGGKEEEGTNGHQVEVPSNRVTPESVIDSGQIGCKQSESNTELKNGKRFNQNYKLKTFQY